MSEVPLFLTQDLSIPHDKIGNEIPENLLDNINTDELIHGPNALLLKTEEIKEALLSGLSDWDSSLLRDRKGEGILVAGESLGIGSSRENAAEAVALNFRIVFAKSFGPIFLDNLINQGVYPSTDFELLGRMLSGYEPEFNEITEGLSYVQKRILDSGGLPDYIQSVRQGREALPQYIVPEREIEDIHQTAVEKMCTHASQSTWRRFNHSEREIIHKEGDPLVISMSEFVGYDVFVAHMQRVLNQYFAGEINFNPNHIWLFNDHFRDLENPNAQRAVRMTKQFALQNPGSYLGESGVYNKVLPLKLPPKSVVAGMDSHSLELGVVPGVLVIPIGYTAGAAALANEGLVPYTVPPTLKLNIVGELPDYSDTKDAVWNWIHNHFSRSDGNGMMFEIGGSGYEKLPFIGAATMFNGITEMGGIGAVGTTLNPQVIKYLRAHGNNLSRISDDELEQVFESIKPDDEANYEDVLTLDLGTTKPAIVGPHEHKKVTFLSEMNQAIAFDRVIFNSCSGSDLLSLAILNKVLDGRPSLTPVNIHLADPLTRYYGEKMGIIASLKSLGVRIAEEESCGPCLGQGARVEENEVVLSTNNRPYQGRMGSKKAIVYASSGVVAAITAKIGKSPTEEEVKSHSQLIAAAKEEVERTLQ